MQRITRLSLALGFVCFTAVAGQAQGFAVMTAHVPFAFTVDGRETPAGDYEVRQSNDLDVLMIVGPDKKTVATLLVRPADNRSPAEGSPSLVFGAHDNTRQLREVWLTGEDGIEVSTPSPHRSHAAAKAGESPDVVVMLTNAR